MPNRLLCFSADMRYQVQHTTICVVHFDAVFGYDFAEVPKTYFSGLCRRQQLLEKKQVVEKISLTNASMYANCRGVFVCLFAISLPPSSENKAKILGHWRQEQV